MTTCVFTITNRVKRNVDHQGACCISSCLWMGTLFVKYVKEGKCFMASTMHTDQDIFVFLIWVKLDFFWTSRLDGPSTVSADREAEKNLFQHCSNPTPTARCKMVLLLHQLNSVSRDLQLLTEWVFWGLVKWKIVHRHHNDETAGDLGMLHRSIHSHCEATSFLLFSVLSSIPDSQHAPQQDLMSLNFHPAWKMLWFYMCIHFKQSKERSGVIFSK